MSVAHSKEELLNITILDTEAEMRNQLLYSSPDQKNKGKIENINTLGSYSNPYWTRYFDVGDRKWLVVYTHKHSPNDLTIDWLPYIALFLGILLTSFLSIYLFLAHWRLWQLRSLKDKLHGVQKRLSGEQKLVVEQTIMRERLQIENDEKTRFLHAVSHDLRQPLNSMGLYLQQLLSDKKLSRHKTLNKIQLNFTSLTRMLDTLLDMARLEAGVIKPLKEPICLSNFLQNLYQEFEKLSEDKNLNLHFRCQDISVYSDPVLLERIVRNLLSNAIRYTKSGRLLLAARKQNDQAIIYVIDTGPGIESNEINTFFEPYIRGSGLKETEGMGLGLSIVKQTAELLEHNIEYRSEIDKGTCFKIIISDVRQQATEEVKETSKREPSKKINHILLVDDDKESLQALSELLHNWGYETSDCESLNESLKILKTQTMIDLIIADYNLSDGKRH